MPKIWITNPSNICNTLTTEEINNYSNSIFKELVKDKIPYNKQKRPQLIIPIGSPGAGKSTITKLLVKYHSDININNYVEFDVDNLLDYLPIGGHIRNIPDINGKKTKIGYAFGWIECLEKISSSLIFLIIQKLIKSNYNLILHIHNYEIIIDAQLAGYFCILVYIAVSKNIATERTLNRSFETGRFLQNGWKKSVDWYLKEYREKAVWYALWADRFVIVNNNINNYYPTAKDFKVLITHPMNDSKNINNWRLHIKKLYTEIDKIHISKLSLNNTRRTLTKKNSI